MNKGNKSVVRLVKSNCSGDMFAAKYTKKKDAKFAQKEACLLKR